MKTLAARIAGLSRRAKTLLAAGGALLLVAIVALVLTLALRPRPAFLAGAAADWKTPVKYWTNTYRCLATTTEYLGQPGKYMVRLWDCTEKPLPDNKVWTFVTAPDGSGAFMKSSAGGSEVCLDVEGGAAKENATVTTFPCKTENYANQIWNVNRHGFSNGMYEIEAGRSGLCLTQRSAFSGNTYFALGPCEKAETWEF